MCRHTDTFRDIHTLTHIQTHTLQMQTTVTPAVPCALLMQPLLRVEHAAPEKDFRLQGPPGVKCLPLWLGSIWQVTAKLLFLFRPCLSIVDIACALDGAGRGPIDEGRSHP